jgi:trimeric autotransporter adhesin
MKFKYFTISSSLVVLLLTLSSFYMNGQSIFSNPITGANPSGTNPYTTGQLVDPNLTVSGIGRGNGVNAVTVVNAFAADNWNSPNLDANDYFEWVLTPAGGYVINFQSLNIALEKSNNNAFSGIVLRSSADNFSNDIFTFGLTGTTEQTFNVNLNGPAFQNLTQTVTFRIYGWGSGNNNRRLQVNSFTFNGSVTAPPLLVVAPTDINFDNQPYNVPSNAQIITLSGTNLLGAPSVVTITSQDSAVEVSNDSITWAGNTTISYATATLNSTPVYVRFTPAFFGDLSTTLTVSGGGANPLVVNVNGFGEGEPPVATAATAITTSGFTANWNAVPGATNYYIDLATYQNALLFSEGFEGGLPPLWNFNNWTISQSGSDLITGGSTLVSTVDGATFTTPAIAYPVSLTFNLERSNNTAKTLVVEVSTTGAAGVYLPVATYTQTATTNNQPSLLTIDLSSYQNEPTVFIRFRRTGTTVWRIDDISITSRQLVPVLGFDNISVGNVTSYAFTGLPSNTEYVYVVRAENIGVTENSNPITVITGIEPAIWDGTSWSNVVGPVENQDAIINGNYNSLTNGEFFAKNVTVNAGVLTIESGSALTLNGALINNGTAANVLINNNGYLVQRDTINNNSGAITVRRDSQALMRLDYTNWSSPVAGQNLLSFSPATLPDRFYTYTTATDLYAVINPSVNTFSLAKGYLIRMPNNHPTTPTVWTGTFIGVPNSGSITYPLETTGSGFNSVGNPFPSSIDIPTFLNDNSSTIGGTLYFWRKTNGAEGSAYITYADGVYSNGPGEPYIAVGQGFLVQALPAGGNVTFTSAARSVNTGTFYRTANEVTNQIERNNIWLSLKKDSQVVAHTLVGYTTGATNGFDASKDAGYINDSPMALVTVVNAKELTIQQRALPFAATDTVGLRFKTNVAGTYTIAIDQLSGLFAGNQSIYLHDLVLNTLHDLKAQPYTFTSVAGIFDARFQLVYENTTLSVAPVIAVSDVIAYVTNQTLTLTTSQQTIQDVAVFDLSGRLVLSKKGISAQTVSFDLSGLARQVVLVQITTDYGTVTKKVVL